MNCCHCSSDRTKHRCLVVDDDAPLSELIAAVVSAESDVAVESFTSSAAALAASAEGGVDLVVTDRDMPELTGLELAVQVRKHSPNAKVILVSAHTDDLSREELDRAGIAAVVSKPFSLEELESALRLAA